MEGPFPSSLPGSVRVQSQDPSDIKLARSQQSNRRPSSAGNSPIHSSTASIPQNLLDAIELASSCGRSPRSARMSGDRPKFVTAFHSPRADQLKIDAYRCLSNGHGPYQGGVLSYEHRKTLKPSDLRKLGKPQFQTALRKARRSEEIGSQKPAELLITSEQEMKLRALSPGQAFSSVREFFGPEFPLAPIAGTESLVRRATQGSTQSPKPQSPLLRPSSPSAPNDPSNRMTAPSSPSFAKVRPESARSPSKLAPSPQFSFSTPLNNFSNSNSSQMPQAERFRPLSAAVGHSQDHHQTSARPEIPNRLILNNLELPAEPASPATPNTKPLTFLAQTQPSSPSSQQLQVPYSPGSARDRRSSGGGNFPAIPANNAVSASALPTTPTSPQPRRLSNASLAPSVARSDAGSFHPVPRMLPPSPGGGPLASPKSPKIPQMSVTLRPVS